MEDVQTVVIPFLDSTIDIEQEIIDNSENATAVADSKTKVAQLIGAKKGWQGLLDTNWNKLQLARNGKLQHVTQLVADALLQDDKGVDNVKYINGTKAPNADALREFSAIRCAM